jgi:hypothetical protein
MSLESRKAFLSLDVGEVMNYLKPVLLMILPMSIVGCVHDELSNYHYQKPPRVRVENEYYRHADVHRSDEGHEIVVRTPRRSAPPRAEATEANVHRG